MDRKQVADALRDFAVRAEGTNVAVAQARGSVACEQPEQGKLFVCTEVLVRLQTTDHRRQVPLRVKQPGQRFCNL